MERTGIKKQNPNHLGFGRLLAWKSSDVSQGWVSILMLNFLSMYASDMLGVNIGVVGSLLMFSKIVDAITDLLAGWLVDNTHTRWGKGRPYELCIVGMTVCTVLLFSASPKWSMAIKCVWISLMYTLTFSIFSTLRAAGGIPYTIRHFSNNRILIEKMSSLGGIIVIMGSLIVSASFPVLVSTFADSAAGWQLCVLIVMIPATIIGLLRFFICKEDPAVEETESNEPLKIKEVLKMFRKNKYVWVYALIMLCYNILTNLAVGSYFFKWVIGDTAMMGVTSLFGVVLLPLMFFFPKIIEKVGSMCKMIAGFCVVSIVGYLICFLSGDFVPGVLIGFLLGQFASLPLTYYGILFIMNVCTYNEMIGLQRMEASSNSMSNFMSKIGAALGSWITGLLLMSAGYVSAEGVTSQPASALLMIRVDYALIPAIMFAIILVCCLAFSKLEVRVREWEKSKENAAQ